MAINPADTTYAIVPEVTPGVTPPSTLCISSTYLTFRGSAPSFDFDT